MTTEFSLSAFTKVLFDWDGTLVDSERLRQTCWVQAGQEFGLGLDEAYFAGLIGMTMDMVSEKLGSDVGGLASVGEIWDRRLTLEQEKLSRGELKAMPGAPTLVKHLLEQGTQLGIVTSSQTKEVRPLLKRFGWEDAFDVLIGKDSVEDHKPHPGPYLKACSELGAMKADTLAVEDTQRGAESALAAGLSVVLVPGLGPIDEAFFKRAGVAGFSSLADLLDQSS